MMHRIIALLGGLIFLLGACQSSGNKEEAATEPDQAQAIVDAAIARHGGDRYEDCRIAFDFRQYRYQIRRQNGLFAYERFFSDTLDNQYHDLLTNNRFIREVNGERVKLTEKDSSSYANSVNSVVYFALLPYFLNDEAVQKEYLGEVTIKGQPYHKIGVTFRQDGGGKDFEDEYVYWIHQVTETLDYLAYNYQVNGGGARLREAYNARNLEGIILQDYHNYKPLDGSMDVKTFDRLLEADSMELVSEILIENPQVVLLSK